MCNFYSLPISDEELHLFTGGMVGKDLRCVYWEDLAVLDNCRNEKDIHQGVISYEVLHWSNWARALDGHPDPWFTAYILSGIRFGFRIWFDHSQSLQPNMHCPTPSRVSDYLSQEVQLNRMWKLPRGVFPREIHISLIGLIPKKNRPNK